MRIDKVRVQNYKSAKDTGWVDIHNDITTFIGKNESGKSSILEAITSFNDSEDYDITVITKEVRREVEDDTAIVSIRFSISENDHPLIKLFSNDDSLVVTKRFDGTRKMEPVAQAPEDDYYEKKLREYMRNEINNITEIIEEETNCGNMEISDSTKQDIIKSLENVAPQSDSSLNEIRKRAVNARNTIENSDLETEQHTYRGNKITYPLLEMKGLLFGAGKAGLESRIYNQFPTIQYIKDLPQLKDNLSGDSDDRVEGIQHRQIQDLLTRREIQFERMAESDRNRALDRIEVDLAKYINRYWTQKSISISVRYNNEEDSFGMKIADTNTTDSNENQTPISRESVSPSERSDGFRWFLSFFIQMLSDSESGKLRNKILLFDDPALKLHSEGKKNWISTIEEMADDAQVIYTAHSPFLISKEYPSRIRIVEDQKEVRTSVTKEFYEASGLALEPLRAALGIGLGDSLFVSKQKILVEGPTDYFVILGLLNYFENIDEEIIEIDQVSVMPANSAQKVPQAANWLATENIEYGILLDSDESGQDAKNEIEDHYHIVDNNRIVMLHKEQIQSGLTIEDIFGVEFYIKCLNKRYSEIVEDFEPVEIAEYDDYFEIEGHEYNGRGIVAIVEEIFSNRSIGDLDKVQVGKEIKSQLEEGNSISDDEVEQFKPILGELRSVIY